MRRRHIPGEGARGARGRRWQELREQRRRGIFLLPSLLTTGNLFCGFLALILTTQRRFTEAAVAVFVAMVLDLLDGKVARLTKTTSQFGVEFDSLADVVSFCVAPAFMLYMLALAPLGRAAWLGVFPVRDLRRAPARPLQRLHRRGRPPLLRGSAHPRRGRYGGRGGSPASMRRRRSTAGRPARSRWVPTSWRC